MIHRSPKGFEAEVLLDSICTTTKKRLRTIKVKYWRAIHAELLTHRALSRNSASSRAIPWVKEGKDGKLVKNCMKNMILTEPFVPHYWGMEQSGMQSGGEVSDEIRALAEASWLRARDACVKEAEYIASLGVHKSICNRLTEPWMYITVIISATEWKNFFHLRCHGAAEKHFQELAGLMREAFAESIPQELFPGMWHLPYITTEDRDWAETYAKAGNPDAVLRMISTGRLARVSYLTHDGRRDPTEDLSLFSRLAIRDVNPQDPMHSSPLEHLGEALADGNERSGNFIGYKQYRKEFPLENIPG